MNSFPKGTRMWIIDQNVPKGWKLVEQVDYILLIEKL